MFLAIRDGVVVEWSSDIDSLLKLDPSTHEVVEWDGPLQQWDIEQGPQKAHRWLDPRTPGQKSQDVKKRYLRRRERAYPKMQRMLKMIYRDLKNGTTEFVDTIDAIDAQFPEPEE
jgi:hypothetical protein